MTPPSTAGPPILYRKPGTVTAAQTFMWLQFSLLLCCGTGGVFAALFSAGFIDEIGVRDDFLEAVENLAVLIVAVIVAVVAVAILFGVLAAKLGSGRRWAQIATILVMLGVIVFGFIGLYTQFQVEEYAGAPVDNSDMVGTLLALAMPIATMICLCTGSANQWFRQGGRDPWLRHWKGAPQTY